MLDSRGWTSGLRSDVSLVPFLQLVGELETEAVRSRDALVGVTADDGSLGEGIVEPSQVPEGVERLEAWRGLTKPAPLSWTTPAQALRLFIRGAALRPAIRVSPVVGTIVSAVNQGDRIVGGTATASIWVRIFVSSVVPFLVSSYGFLAACRGRPAG